MFINHFYFHINVTIEDDAAIGVLSCLALYSLYVYRTVQLLYCLKVVTILKMNQDLQCLWSFYFAWNEIIFYLISLLSEYTTKMSWNSWCSCRVVSVLQIWVCARNSWVVFVTLTKYSWESYAEFTLKLLLKHHSDFSSIKKDDI